MRKYKKEGKTMKKLALALCLCLLPACAAPAPEATPTPAPAAEVTATPSPEPTATPEPTPDPYAWLSDPDETDRYATLADFDHIPLDQLPQELRDSLELAEETDLEGMYTPEWGTYRIYTAPGLELCTVAPSAAYLAYRVETYLEEYPDEAALQADMEGEEGREWLCNVTITGGDYATLTGLKVGMSVQEAEALGYPLEEQDKDSYTAGAGHSLSVTTENGVVTQLAGSWGLGRYIGKFFEL